MVFTALFKQPTKNPEVPKEQAAAYTDVLRRRSLHAFAAPRY